MTLNRVMAFILRHFAQSGIAFRANYVKLTEDRHTDKCSPMTLVLGIYDVDSRFFPDLFRKPTIVSLFDLCNTARPFQQQLSSCFYKRLRDDYY